VERYASPGTAKLLVGNKSDRADKAVTTEVGEAFAANLDIPFLETSAKTSENVEAAFLAMTAQLMKQKTMLNPSPQQRDRKRVSLAAPGGDKSGEGGCCM
jgi:Ras-related protein Rab-1A